MVQKELPSGTKWNESAVRPASIPLSLVVELSLLRLASTHVEYC